jgi:ribosomal protein L40E
MIVCPNCNHQNPDGAVQCEACYTPLPSLASCPSCGASVQTDASFCGQCGFDLRSPQPAPATAEASSGAEISPVIPEIPPLKAPEPLVAPDPIAGMPEPMSTSPDESASASVDPASVSPTPPDSPAAPEGTDTPEIVPDLPSLEVSSPEVPTPPEPDLTAAAADPSSMVVGATQIQVNQAKLIHIQSNNTLELPPSLTVVRIGKPNDRVPPDIDVSGFPNSEIVSRVHAQLRVEGDVYYIEDVGSSNGTYINNMPLPYGNRHRLRPGDRIALGKGDKVSFIFQCP